MKNKVQFMIFLLFGLAFLMCLFPVIFVEAAKLESGVTITAPATIETEKICDDTMDNDNDGKIDAADEDCDVPAGSTAGNCPLQIVSGVPINYGQVNMGWLSAEQNITIKNEGISGTAAKIMIKGGNWYSVGPLPSFMSGPQVTRVAIDANLNYYQKKSLSGGGLELGQIVGGQSIPVYFQLEAPAPKLVGKNSESLFQNVLLELIC